MPHTCYRYNYIAKDGEDVLLHGLLTTEGPGDRIGNTYWCKDSNINSSTDWKKKIQLGPETEVYPYVLEKDGKWLLKSKLSNAVGGFQEHELPKEVGGTFTGKVRFTVPTVSRQEYHQYDVTVTLLAKKDNCKKPESSSSVPIQCTPQTQADINAKAKEDQK